MDQSTPPPLGSLVDFKGAQPPRPIAHSGRFARLRPIHPDTDTEPLYEASHAPTGDPSVWTYLYEGPFEDIDGFRAHLQHQATSVDPLFFTVTRSDEDKPLGVMSLMSIVPEHGTIEIGHIWFGPQLKRTPAATESIFLLARHAFDELGYRRLEWKCNALNQPSRDAAARFGFEFEGVFRSHRVVKGRNRDTAWFAITDEEWPRIRSAFEVWLSPENFDGEGHQRQRLSRLTEK